MRTRHVGIVTFCLEQSIKFYNQLGYKLRNNITIENGKQIEQYYQTKYIEVEIAKLYNEENDCIELLNIRNIYINKTTESLKTSGITHIAFTVKNIEEVRRTIENIGGEIVCEPQISNDNKYCVFFCKDPNGVFLELVEEL
jgi:catechol 2,3-dioxygenase-like lactoylglutathione lyase family enzyme